MSIRQPARKRSAWEYHDWGTIVPVAIGVSLMGMLVVFTTLVSPRARLRYCDREYHAARTAADTAAVDRIMVGVRFETCGTLRARATPAPAERRERGFPAARGGRAGSHPSGLAAAEPPGEIRGPAGRRLRRRSAPTPLLVPIRTHMRAVPAGLTPCGGGRGCASGGCRSTSRR